MPDPPPLPPRAGGRAASPASSVSSRSSTGLRARSETIHLIPDDALRDRSASRGRSPYSVPADQGQRNDPRSSSMQSLRPQESATDSRRLLLIVYIHGFMGDETSFRSFPFHVHQTVTRNVERTHRVHTKIYPKYKSRRDMSFSAEDFSNWYDSNTM